MWATAGLLGFAFGFTLGQITAKRNGDGGNTSRKGRRLTLYACTILLAFSLGVSYAFHLAGSHQRRVDDISGTILSEPTPSFEVNLIPLVYRHGAELSYVQPEPPQRRINEITR